jgi:hypothetical protein
MSQTDRHRRLRLLLKNLNRQRKRQATKIDILCNDLISAQRAFISRLHAISFAAQFYRSLLGSTDLNDLLSRAARAIKQELPGVSVSFFLRHSDNCERYVIRDDPVLPPGAPEPEDSFTPELINGICKSNRPCTLDDKVGMGLEGNLEGLNRFSIATLPLKDLGRSLGFVVLYRRSPQVLGAEELDRVNTAMCGLSQAIRSVRVPLHDFR